MRFDVFGSGAKLWIAMLVGFELGDFLSRVKIANLRTSNKKRSMKKDESLSFQFVRTLLSGMPEFKDVVSRYGLRYGLTYILP